MERNGNHTHDKNNITKEIIYTIYLYHFLRNLFEKWSIFLLFNVACDL